MQIQTPYHHSTVTTPVASVGSAFNTAKVHLHTLIPGTTSLGPAPTDPPRTRTRLFASRVEGLHIHVSSIAGGATKLTVRICADAAGNYSLVPDTEATLALGVTTATEGCVAFQVGIPLFPILNGDSRLWVFIRTDAGTVTVDASCITWSE